MPQPIKVIATDLDGTLLNSDHVLTSRTERALKAATARGVQVIFATGKTAHSRPQLVEQLGIRTPGVYSQGLVLMDRDGAILYRRDMEAHAARPVVDYATDHGYNVIAIAEAGARILAERPSTLSAFMVAHHEPEAEIVPSLSDSVLHTPITKLLIEIPPENLPAARDELAARLNGAVEIVRSMPQLLEFLPKGASKGDGLRRLLAMMHVNPAHVLALGDADNDLEMLELAGIGVAMGNATDRVKAIANHITTSNNEDGVALAVERFVLNGQH